MDSTTDTTQPDGKWEFDGDVAAAFDDMLERSIPQYKIMRASCFDLACHYAKQGTCILDLGCSRGEAIADLVQTFGAHCHFVGLECSQPMLEVCRERFKHQIEARVVEIRNMDLRTDFYSAEKASVILSVLTLQFVPIEYRQQLLAKVYDLLVPGGAFILVEKLLGPTAHLDELFVKQYYDLKENNGYTVEDIERKRLSLEGVLVPVTAHWNEELLRGAGFQHVDCFWRWMNFAGFVAVKR